MLEFYSTDSENNEVRYMSVYEKHNDTFIFVDKSAENTKVELKIGTEFSIKRFGKIHMDFPFDENKITNGIYQNDLGLSIEFSIKTNQVFFRNNIFYVSYDLNLDGDFISSHVIKIKFF